MAVRYIPLGALTMVWTVIWSLPLQRHPPVRDSTWLWCLGFFLTGITFFGIGLTVGYIGRSARQADTGEHVNAPVAAPAPPPAAAAPPPTPAQIANALAQKTPRQTV